MSPGRESDPTQRESDGNPADGRRDFILKAGSVCAGCALPGIPVAAGLRVVAHPVTGSNGAAVVGGEAPFLRVTRLDALPQDGSPAKFIVRADKSDAWSRFPNQVIGAAPSGYLWGRSPVPPVSIPYDGDPGFSTPDSTPARLGAARFFVENPLDFSGFGGQFPFFRKSSRLPSP